MPVENSCPVLGHLMSSTLILQPFFWVEIPSQLAVPVSSSQQNCDTVKSQQSQANDFKAEHRNSPCTSLFIFVAKIVAAVQSAVYAITKRRIDLLVSQNNKPAESRASLFSRKSLILVASGRDAGARFVVTLRGQVEAVARFNARFGY
jgi:hypothetical protein